MHSETHLVDDEKRSFTFSRCIKDVLTIVIELTIRKIIYEDEQTVLTTSEKNLFNQYKELYSKLDKENSNHKSILSIISPVFKGMFKVDMEENEKNELTIDYIEEKVLKVKNC